VVKLTFDPEATNATLLPLLVKVIRGVEALVNAVKLDTLMLFTMKLDGNTEGFNVPVLITVAFSEGIRPGLRTPDTIQDASKETSLLLNESVMFLA
jgi:hypothetical protein